MKVLVLCTGNSARSILAEAILNHDGAGRIEAHSAGSNPTGRVHPEALNLLSRRGLPTEGYRSKSWEEFVAPGAPRMDLVLTVCAAAAGEVCPVWPGAPFTAHWGVPDPAAAPADEIKLAFQHTYHRIAARAHALLALPFEDMARGELSRRLAEIGQR